MKSPLAMLKELREKGFLSLILGKKDKMFRTR